MAEACYVSAMIRLGPFQLEDHIGQGGMGAIWQARHVNQDLPAAVKVLHSERASEPGFERAFIREVRAVSQLHHPNIVEVYDHGLVSPEASEASGGRIKEGTPYLAMELVPGGNLAEHRGRMPWPMLRGCLLDLLSALALSLIHI